MRIGKYSAYKEDTNISIIYDACECMTPKQNIFSVQPVASPVRQVKFATWDTSKAKLLGYEVYNAEDSAMDRLAFKFANQDYNPVFMIADTSKWHKRLYLGFCKLSNRFILLYKMFKISKLYKDITFLYKNGTVIINTKSKMKLDGLLKLCTGDFIDCGVTADSINLENVDTNDIHSIEDLGALNRVTQYTTFLSELRLPKLNLDLSKISVSQILDKLGISEFYRSDPVSPDKVFIDGVSLGDMKSQGLMQFIPC